MQEYFCQLSEGWGLFHECDSFSYNGKRELTSLVLYFPQEIYAGDRVQAVTCSVKEYFLFIEVQRVKEDMKHRKYYQELGATAACTKRIMEATKGIGQNYRKGATMDCFLFDKFVLLKEIFKI